MIFSHIDSSGLVYNFLEYVSLSLKNGVLFVLRGWRGWCVSVGGVLTWVTWLAC